MNQSSNNPLNTYVLYSGAAYGADKVFSVLAHKYGVGTQYHIRPIGNTKIHKEIAKLGYTALVADESKLAKARVKIKELIGLDLDSGLGANLKTRNYYQVSNTESVLAVAKIIGPSKVSGGTDVAVGLSIALNLPTYVLNTEDGLWYFYDSTAGQFVVYNGIPPLTRKFTGVGTRDIENYNVLNKFTNQWEPRPQFIGEDKVRHLINKLEEVFQQAVNS